jgi:hypothetical protein
LLSLSLAEFFSGHHPFPAGHQAAPARVHFFCDKKNLLKIKMGDTLKLVVVAGRNIHPMQSALIKFQRHR